MSVIAMLRLLLRIIILEGGTATVSEGNFWFFKAGMIAGIHHYGALSCTTQFQIVSQPIEIRVVAAALRNFQSSRIPPFFACCSLPDKKV